MKKTVTKPVTSKRKAGAPVVKRIVEASGTASGRMASGKSPIGGLIEAAMQQAVVDANAKGINDPKVILKLKLEARERVKKEARSQV